MLWGNLKHHKLANVHPAQFIHCFNFTGSVNKGARNEQNDQKINLRAGYHPVRRQSMDYCEWKVAIRQVKRLSEMFWFKW